jgi:hypothetical protein
VKLHAGRAWVPGAWQNRRQDTFAARAMPTAFRAPGAAFLECGVACQPSGTLDGIGRASQAGVFHRILGSNSNTVLLEGSWIRTFFAPGIELPELFFGVSTKFSHSMLKTATNLCKT